MDNTKYIVCYRVEQWRTHYGVFGCKRGGEWQYHPTEHRIVFESKKTLDDHLNKMQEQNDKALCEDNDRENRSFRYHVYYIEEVEVKSKSTYCEVNFLDNQPKEGYNIIID